MQVKIYESCRAAFDNGALVCNALECTFVYSQLGMQWGEVGGLLALENVCQP